MWRLTNNMVRLGRVDKSDPEADGAEEDHGQIGSRGLFVARGDAPVLFEFVDQPLDQVAQTIELLVVADIFGSIGARWNDRFDIAVAQVNANVVVVIGLVAEHRVGVVLTQRHQVIVGLTVVNFTAGQRDDERQAVRFGPDVDLGREAATRTTEGLFPSPPFAPAAC